VTWVKICGLTRPEDAEWAIECGADAIGFIFEPTSPRGLSPNDIDWISGLESPVPKTAVFGNYFEIDLSPFDVVQAIAPVPECGLAVTASIRPRSLDEAEACFAQAGMAKRLMIDAYSPSAFGGTGERADWHLAEEIVKRSPLPVILAGGLAPENAADAIQAVRPFGLDVSSGVESAPGVKDRAKISDFIAAVREFDSK
jgi:phosphoribosylanthranilate isomerase